MSHYDAYYGSAFTERERAWRQLGARFKADNIGAMCATVPHRRIIDVGAGDGAISAELSNRGFAESIVCVDVSESGVDEIRKRGIPAVTEVKQFDGYHTGYPDGHFELAVCSHVLEHVEHQRLFLQELARIAATVFIEVPLEDILRGPLDYRPQKARYLDHIVGHINFYNYKTLRRLMQTCELDVIDQHLFASPFAVHRFHGRARDYLEFGVRRLSDLVSMRLAARFFSHHCGILARAPADPETNRD